MNTLSLIILSRNEEKIIINNLKLISDYVKQLPQINNYEILVCDKSEDSTPFLVKTYANQNIKIKYHDVPKKGIGAAMKYGISQSKFDIMMIYPIDMAWKLDSISNSIDEIINGSDIVYGSRYAPGSNVHRPFKRRFYSFGYRILIRILFNVHIKDLNGTIAMRKSSILKFKDDLEDDAGFFPTELAIYGINLNLKVTEIPTSVVDLRNTSNDFIFHAASNMLSGAIKKRLKLWFQKKKDI